MSHSEFTLKCSDEGFIARQKNLFLALSEIEKKVNNKEEPMEIQSHCEKRRPKIHKSETKVFRGKDSIFKTPQDPVPKNFLRKLPDFKKNPHKWTKYTLDDVKDEDITDRANTKAALSFLRDLENRNKIVEKNVDMTDTKIVFRRPISTSTSNQETQDKPSFKSSKIVMPEYVIGQKIKKERKPRSTKVDSTNTKLKLDHLFEDEEE